MEGIFFSVQQPKCRRQLYECICRPLIATGSFRVQITMHDEQPHSLLPKDSKYKKKISYIGPGYMHLGKKNLN